MRLLPLALLLAACATQADDTDGTDDTTDTDGADTDDTDAGADTDGDGVRAFVPPASTPSEDPGSFVLTLASLRQRYLIDGGAPLDVEMRQVGTRVFGNLDLPELRFFGADDADVGMSLYLGMNGRAAAVGGFSTPAALNGVDLDVVLDPAFVIDSESPVGERQAVEIDGTITLASPGTEPGEAFLPLVGGYTLEDEDDVAETPLGEIPGCWRFGFDADTGPLGFAGTVWAHRSLGLVAADVDGGSLGTFKLGSRAYVGWDTDEARSALQAEAVINGIDRFFRTSTRDATGAADVVRGSTARLFVELRWNDPRKATGSEPPPVDVRWISENDELAVLQIAQSAVPLLHPEAAELGYVWWTAEAEVTVPAGEGLTSLDVTFANQVDDTFPIKVGAYLVYDRQP
jgi:hypothetical protein